MALPHISASDAKKLLDEGAILVDVREPAEHARERIPGAHLLPLSKLDEADLAVHRGKPVIFHCRSGARTMTNAGRLAGKTAGSCEAFVVEGGIEAWKQAGLPVATDRSRQLELQRQVQIGAGGLALVGTILGVVVSPWFLAVPAFVGAGLLVAGMTGACGMTGLLVHAPWNKAACGR